MNLLLFLMSTTTRERRREEEEDEDARMCLLCAMEMTKKNFLFSSKIYLTKSPSLSLSLYPCVWARKYRWRPVRRRRWFSLQRYFQTRARSTKVYSDEVYFDETVDANAATTTTTTRLCRRDDEKCSHFLCGTSNVVVILLPVLRIVDNFIPFYVGLIEMTRALETRSVVRALHA